MKYLEHQYIRLLLIKVHHKILYFASLTCYISSLCQSVLISPEVIISKCIPHMSLIIYSETLGISLFCYLMISIHWNYYNLVFYHKCNNSIYWNRKLLSSFCNASLVSKQTLTPPVLHNCTLLLLLHNFCYIIRYLVFYNLIS